MLRYLILYLHFIRFSISRAFEFRVDFFFRVFMDLAYFGVNFAFYKVIFFQTSVLGGWNKEQSLVFMAGFLVLDGITMTIFSNNLWVFPILVNKGDLDYYLVRPISSLFFITLRDFAANSFLNLLFAIGVFIWALIQLPMHFTFLGLTFYLLLLLCGALLHSILHFLIILPVFWLQSGTSLHNIFFNMARFMERPDRIFTGWGRKILITVLPFCLMASFPARIFLEGLDFKILLHFFVVLVLFCAFTLFAWRQGLRAYASASS